MANEVKITFAGDSQQLEKSMASVGDSAKRMGDQVGDASKSFTDAGSGFDRAAEGFDRAEQRAMGFRDTITGVQDSVKGFGSILKGDFSGDALLAAGMGVGDLASGFSNFLVPQLKAAVTWLGKTKVATAIATAAQWLWNFAMSANPIGIIILAIGALIGIIFLLVKNWDTVKEAAGKAWDWIKDKAIDFWNWLKELPNRIKDSFLKIVDFISAPFRAAFNKISDAWNNTIGRLSWTVPSWVPFIGGNTLSAPRLPRFHTGGIVPGPPTQEMLALLRGGEHVSTSSSGGNQQPMQGDVYLDGQKVGRVIWSLMSNEARVRGGNPQVSMGR